MTINPGNASRVYGDPNPAFTFTYAGLVNGDVTIATPPTCNTSTPLNTGVGSYQTITCTGAASPNYTIAYGPNGTLTITARAITVTADAKSKVYGDADPALTYQITSGTLVSGDSFSGSLTRAAGANVGTYAILQGTLTAGTNYNLTYVGADLTITPKPITVTADAKTKVYGSADPALTYQVTSGSLVAGDNFSGALTRAAGANVGAYAILQGTLTAGTNYTLTFVSANLTITPAPLTINPGDASRVYGDPNPAFTFTYASLVNGDIP